MRKTALRSGLSLKKEREYGTRKHVDDATGDVLSGYHWLHRT